jgi:hypothetical protein
MLRSFRFQMLRDRWRINASSPEHHTEGALPTRSDSTQVVLGFYSTHR